MTNAEKTQALLTKVRAGKATPEEKEEAKKLRAALTTEEVKAHALSARK